MNHDVDTTQHSDDHIDSHSADHDARLDHPTTVVLIDPTSHDGELALELLGPDDDHVSLVVLLSGRASSALREYAVAEQMALADAGWIYLDQVANRISRHRAVETILANGPDPATELAYIVSDSTVARVIVPPSTLRHDASAIDRLVDHVPSSVAVAVASLATAGH